MKSIKFSISLVMLLLIFQSCEDVLDRSPLDKISESVVWSDQSMVTAYVTNLYTRIPWFTAFENYNNWYSWCDEGTRSTGNASIITQGTISKTNENNAYWDYGYIRDCNIFIEKMATSTLDKALTTQLEGEVRFMRAFAYFEMMKRYGGVPLVDVVIDPFEKIDEKYEVRAKEADIANFIDSELTTAIGMLSGDPDPRGKINKWTAYALDARAMLWAASIAKYGTVALDGIVGIPSSQANTYYAKASAAADAVIGSGNYCIVQCHTRG